MSSEYIGDELFVFRKAKNWKQYWSALIFDNLPNNLPTFEIGSGIGSNAQEISRYTDLYQGVEPDTVLVEIAKKTHPEFNFKVGNVKSIDFPTCPVSVLYIDVLEHIEDDRQEFLYISENIPLNSYVGVIVPAHMSLYSDFDRKIGHYRRYSKDSFIEILPEGLSLLFIKELDCIGYLLSKLGTRLYRSGNVSITQVAVWDSLIIFSRILDRLNLFKGKSIVAVLKKDK
jgi:hypothetical protein